MYVVMFLTLLKSSVGADVFFYMSPLKAEIYRTRILSNIAGRLLL